MRLLTSEGKKYREVKRGELFSGCSIYDLHLTGNKVQFWNIQQPTTSVPKYLLTVRRKKALMGKICNNDTRCAR